MYLSHHLNAIGLGCRLAGKMSRNKLKCKHPVQAELARSAFQNLGWTQEPGPPTCPSELPATVAVAERVRWILFGI